MLASTEPSKRGGNLKTPDSPAAFIALLKSGISHITEAAMMLKRLVDRNKGVIEEIRSLEPTIAPAIFTKLLLVAEGHLMPELLMNSAPVFKHLQTLPVAVQKEAIKRGTIDVVIDAASGEHRPVPLAEVQTRHIPQVFDQAGLRDIQGQRDFLKKMPRRQAPVAAVELPWVVKGGKCIFTRPCVVTGEDLLRIIVALFTKENLLRLIAKFY
jgi:hypothetical protein